MDTLSTVNPVQGPRIEIYTDMLVIQGALTMTGQRTSDLLNRASTEFLALHNATITPMGQLATTKALDTLSWYAARILFWSRNSLQSSPLPPLRAVAA